jgi:hypothetical protein
MDLSETTLAYLRGERFSAGAHFDLGNRGPALRRIDRLVELARGRRVLHIGCCDHAPLVADKIARGIYLHKNLCDVASACVGADTNADGVQQLRQLGFAEVYGPADVPAQDFDICLAPDVIEHVGDPVSFLRGLRQYRFERLVIATPNVFRWRNALPGGECVNTDHRFWFSPFTLCKVLVDAGYRPTQLELCHGDFCTWRGALAARLLGRVPRWRETLIVQASTA